MLKYKIKNIFILNYLLNTKTCMRSKKIGIIFTIVTIVTLSGLVSPVNMALELQLDGFLEEYSHNIFGEFGTKSGCLYCGITNAALKNLYYGEYHPFYYTTLVCAKNKNAEYRGVNELGISTYPTVFWDGGWRTDIGASSIESAMNKYNYSIIKCGERNVADIDISVDIEWLGAVNPIPEDGETNAHIEPTLKWNISAMNIDIIIENNETYQYDGHLHVYVTEPESSYWLDYYDLPYTFAFLDYAWNEDIQISAGDNWEDALEWDGVDYNNGKTGDDLIIFDEIFQDNIMVIASVFNDGTNHSDETAGILAGENTYPKTHDIYFGNTTPPIKVVSNQTELSYSPNDVLDWNTTYYWKIITWDNQDNPAESPIYNFTTRDNHAPNIPSNPYPPDSSIDIPINATLNWTGGDPDNDTVYYDVYFGPIFPPSLVSANQTWSSYDPGILLFDKEYYWKIVAWDRWGYKSISSDWSFSTQENLPPNEPSNPSPQNGANDVPINANLSWIGGDPNQGDVVKYDVYLEKDDETPDKLVSEQQLEEVFDPIEDFEIFETYFWQIIAWDSMGLSTTSEVWSFTTGINNPPEKPSITGEIKGKVEEEYEYIFISNDPEEDNVSYLIDWGDGVITDWIGPFSSGYELKLSHNWTEKGEYIIKAKVKDKYQESEWSQLKIKMPKYNFFNIILNPIKWLFEHFLNVFPILGYILVR
jgi:hypothetical protein